MSWRTPLAASALSLVVVAQLRVLRPGLTAESYMTRLQMAAMVLAAAASVALDDPAAPLLVSSPTVLRARSGVRIAVAVAWWVVGWTPTIVVLSLTPDHLDLTEIGLQATALLVLALGVSAVAGQIAGAAVVAAVGLAAFVVPAGWSVLEDDGGAHLRVGVLIAFALAALVCGTRDRAAKRLSIPRSTSPPTRTIAP